MTRILGIVGSPRLGRNTATLVAKALEGARSVGCETEMVYIDDHQPQPCQACDACKSGSGCVQHDGMDYFYAALREAQGMVLGTPIYFDHVSAQTKTFLDRFYAYMGPNMEHYFPQGFKAALVVTYGDAHPTLYDNVVNWLDRRLGYYFDIETVGAVLAPNADARPMAEQTDRLQAAFDAGVKLGRSLISAA